MEDPSLLGHTAWHPLGRRVPIRTYVGGFSQQWGTLPLRTICTKDWCFGLVVAAHFMLSDSRERRFVTDEAIDVEYGL